MRKFALVMLGVIIGFLPLPLLAMAMVYAATQLTDAQYAATAFAVGSFYTIWIIVWFLTD